MSSGDHMAMTRQLGPPLPPPPPFPPPLESVQSLPLQLQHAPPMFHPLVPPPIFNPHVPLPLIHSFPPPPIHNLPQNNFSANTLSHQNSPIDKFKYFLQTWKDRYKSVSKETRNTDQIKISDIKLKLLKCLNIIRQLERLSNSLEDNYKLLSDESWNSRCREAHELKAELIDLMEDFNNPHLVKVMKRKILLRKKKREYKKRKQKEWMEEKREVKLCREKEERRINLWLENMKDQLSRAKREEDIKREADLVLSDVTMKKAEAKRILNMLNSLGKLRASRAQNLSCGTPNQEHPFTQVIDRLKKMWVDQLNGYKVEEEGLKVMLGHEEEKRMSNETTQLRRNLKAWYHCIFGSSGSSHSQSDDELIQIRSDWDKFICRTDAPMASSIPVGWVLPSQPSSQQWATLIQNKP